MLPTTLAPLDAQLGGGLPTRSVTEVVGPPGAGKTQWCHMMAVLATLPLALGGLEGAVLYLDTEGAFSPDRLVEVAATRLPHHFATSARLSQLASNVLVHRFRSSRDLSELLRSNLEELVIADNVKLVVLDSVASAARRDFDSKEVSNRQQMLVEHAQLLKHAAGKRID